jgi:CheY-like chemotaxis protein
MAISSRTVLSETLVELGLENAQARSGLEQIKTTIENNCSFNFVVMDWRMPEMNGLSATSAIRTELNIDTPIVAMTAHNLPEEIERSEAVGMNIRLTKPISLL